MLQVQKTLRGHDDAVRCVEVVSWTCDRHPQRSDKRYGPRRLAGIAGKATSMCPAKRCISRILYIQFTVSVMCVHEISIDRH